MSKLHDPDLISQERKTGQLAPLTLELLTPFLGVWTGRGKGGYPTIDAFDYSETFRVYQIPDLLFLAYEQSTELIDSEGHPIRKSHWETGILRPLEDGSIELACIQGGGRVEILRGAFLAKEPRSGSRLLRFQSELIGNDERARSTSREWSLNGNHLNYIMKMVTSRVENPTLHLEANLYRS